MQMTTKSWMLRGALAGLGLASVTAQANAEFIRRDTRIEGCIAIVDDVRNGTISPTEWLEQNKEEFRDLDRELKKRKYKPDAAKGMLMGMAITFCMTNKGYVNQCVVSQGEDGDLQMMQTANIYACWTRQKTARPPDPPPAILPPDPPPPPMPPPSPLPAMSPADMQQYQEDLSIISQPTRIIGDDENGAKEARLSNCLGYWQSLHYNRPPQVREVLYAIRVWRCMFRTGYTIMEVRCPNTANAPVIGWGDGRRGTGISGVRNPYCYARFA
jgi:hypothetical protein